MAGRPKEIRDNHLFVEQPPFEIPIIKFFGDSK